MSETPVGLVLPQTADVPRIPVAEDVGEFGRTVEDLGYESVWLNESWGSDPIAELTAVARATEELLVGTAIVNAFTRTPASLAMSASTMARLSGGRFILGIGAGHPELVEGLHDLPWERPVHRMHETLSLVTELLDDDLVEYESDLFDVSGVTPLDADVPIYSAALGPANRRVTGKLSDGWIPYHVPVDELAAAFETVAGAARAAGRDPDAVAVVPYIACVVDEDRDAARNGIRANVARYVGGFSDGSYRNAVGAGFAEEADRIAAAWRRGDQDTARAVVTDEMVDALGIAGTPTEARERLQDLRDRPIVDRVLISVPHQIDEETADRTVRELAPDRP